LKPFSKLKDFPAYIKNNPLKVIMSVKMKSYVKHIDIYRTFIMTAATFIFLISFTIQITAQKIKNSKVTNQETRETEIPSSTQTTGEKIEIKNGNGNAIITITDEGNDEGSITLSKMLVAPGTVDNKLYNVAGTLMFNGSSLSGSGANEIGDLSDARSLGNSVFLGSGAGANDDGSDNKNYGLGINSLGSNTTGYANAALGFNSLFFNTEGIQNVGLGQGSLYSNTTGDNNIAVGYHSNHFNQTGSNNTILGYQAGRGSSTHSKSGNVFIGYQAGYNETSDNKLYIENSNSSTPLIWGDFLTNKIKINGDFHVTGNITSDGTALSDNDWDVNGNELLLMNPTGQFVGIGTTLTETLTKLHVKGDEGVLFQGTHGNGTPINLGEGTRFHIYQKNLL